MSNSEKNEVPRAPIVTAINDPRIAPLLEWNRLARENAENAIVRSMFDAASTASPSIEKFATWLLVGTAAVGSFVIGNADKVVPMLGSSGFRAVGASLCCSCLFGLLSKVFALRHGVALGVTKAIQNTFLVQLAKHEEEERRIQQSAEFWGITLESAVRLDRVFSEFLAPMPPWVRWQASRFLTKNKGNPQIDSIKRMRSLYGQAVMAFLQALSFLMFLVLGFGYAAGL